MRNGCVAVSLALLVFAGGAPRAAIAQTTVADKTIATGNAKVLQLETGGGDLKLVPSASSGSVRVRIEQSGAAAGVPQIQSATRGNRTTIAIGGAGGSSLVPFAAAAAMTFEVDYPPSMRLDVRAASGNVMVVKPLAGVEIFDGGGDVTIDSPQAAVTAESSRGDVVATGAAKNVDLAADAGDVKAVLAPGWSGSEVRLQSASGDVEITVPPGFLGRFDATGGKGGVHNEFGPSNARGPLVWLYAPSGDVYIRTIRR